jgi:UMF1 family MFS transporter
LSNQHHLLTNDKREIFGWTMYDWANSAFSTTVATVFLGPYLTSLANAAADSQKLVYLLGNLAPLIMLLMADFAQSIWLQE